jgi:molybdenum cofactor cytidylyltransferase
MGFPKALLRYREKSFLESALAASRAVGLEPSVVVLGKDADKILSSIDLERVLVVRNQHPETGQIGSMRKAVEQLINHPVDAALFWPVDLPHVAISTIDRLVQRFRELHQPVVVPTYRGRRGHPVLFSRTVFPELIQAPEITGARAVLRADPRRVLEVPVQDSAVLQDIDTPEAYEALIRGSSGPGH